MNLDIYFKPIEKFEIKNCSIGSFCEFYEVNFPNWEDADIVLISVEQQNSFNDSFEDEFFHFLYAHQIHSLTVDPLLSSS